MKCQHQRSIKSRTEKWLRRSHPLPINRIEVGVREGLRSSAAAAPRAIIRFRGVKFFITHIITVVVMTIIDAVLVISALLSRARRNYCASHYFARLLKAQEARLRASSGARLT